MHFLQRYLYIPPCSEERERVVAETNVGARSEQWQRCILLRGSNR